jgi:bla regulator protein blaR1
MIALWILYSIAIAFAFGGAAVLLERALRWQGRPARVVWPLAMTASSVLPVFSVLRALASAAPDDAPLNHASRVQSALTNLGALLDRPILLAWCAATLALVLAIALAQRALLRARASWRELYVDGTNVLVSPDVGPGVWAIGRARIVVPSWCLTLDAEGSALLIAHEREHLRARDHWLLLFGLFVVLLFPLNAGLWWQFRRLKLAIEMDCDARVLSGRQDVRGYATLLLDVGQRCRTGHLAFAAFAAPPHAIERRIRMMLDPKPRSHRLLAGVCAVGAVLVGVLACATPEPESPDTAVRSALGINETLRSSEGNPVDAEKELYEVRVEGVELRRALADEDLLPPPPPPPPPPPEPGDKAITSLRKVKGSSLEVAETRSLPRKQQQ